MTGPWWRRWRRAGGVVLLSAIDAGGRRQPDLEEVTGHPAPSFAQWAADHRADFT